MDTKHYKITTGHGSSLTLSFKQTGYYDEEKLGEQLPVGDCVLTGYARSVGKVVRMAGVGFAPETGGYIAVDVIGEEEDGMAKFAKELITNMERLEGATHGGDSPAVLQ